MTDSNKKGVIGSARRDDPGGGSKNISSLSIVSSESPFISTSNSIRTTTKDVMKFSYTLKNHVRFEGETLRLTCEAQGNPPPLKIQWYKDHLPLENQSRRIKIRRKELEDDSALRSVVRFRKAEEGALYII